MSKHDETSSSTPSFEDVSISRDQSSTPVTQRRRGRPSKPTEVQTESGKVSAFTITTRGQKARDASLPRSGIHSQDMSHLSASASRSNSTGVSTRSSLRASHANSVAATPPPAGMKLRDKSRKRETEDENKLQKQEEKGTRGRSTASNRTVMNGTTKDSTEKKSDSMAPSCMTCSSSLPADDIDVLAVLNYKGKGKNKMKEIEKDCTRYVTLFLPLSLLLLSNRDCYIRCERHLAIWGAPWPHRIPTPGSRDSSSRANTPSELGLRVTNATISTVDQKLQRARLMQLKRNREAHDQEDGEKDPKKLKTEVTATPASTRYWAPSRSSDDKPKVKVENADEIPLHTPTPIVDGAKQNKRCGSESTSPDSEKQKRRKTSISKTADEIDEEDYSLHGLPPVDENGDDRRDKTFWPALPSPQPEHMFRRSWLDLRPNPMHVSRWRAPSKPMRSSASTGSIPTLVDDSDDAASDHHPSTPENNDCEQVSTPRVAIGADTNGVHEQPPVSDEEDEEPQVWTPPYSGLLPVLRSRTLICKPNPIAMSKLARSIDVTEPSSDSDSGSSMKIKSEEEDDEENGPPFTPTQTSSGEEDIVIPSVSGPSASDLYRLQTEVDFSRMGSARTSATPEPDGCLVSTSRTVDTISSPITHVVKPSSLTSSPSLAKILNPSLSVGPLHSEFISDLSIPTKSPALVSAGWDSDCSATL